MIWYWDLSAAIWSFVASSMDDHRYKLWLPEEFYIVQIIIHLSLPWNMSQCSSIYRRFVNKFILERSRERERQLFQIIQFFRRHLLKTGTYFNQRQRQRQREGQLFWISFDSFWNMSNCLSNFGMNDTWIEEHMFGLIVGLLNTYLIVWF